MHFGRWPAKRPLGESHFPVTSWWQAGTAPAEMVSMPFSLQTRLAPFRAVPAPFPPLSLTEGGILPLFFSRKEKPASPL